VIARRERQISIGVCLHGVTLFWTQHVQAMVKRVHCGRAARSGVYSALLARRGFTGIDDVLEAAYAA
jgi:2-methylcitrate dehydratase PrpD